MLSEGAVRRTAGTSTNGDAGSGSHVLCRDSSGVDGERTVQGHQRSAHLGIGMGINLAALSAAEEVVEVIIAALAGIKTSRVGEEVTSSVNVLSVIADGAICLGRWWWVGIVARMPGVRWLTKGGRVSTDMAIVIIIARRSFAAVCSVSCTQAAALVLRGPYEH